MERRHAPKGATARGRYNRAKGVYSRGGPVGWNMLTLYIGRALTIGDGSTFVMSGLKNNSIVQSSTMRRRRSHSGIWNR